MVAAVSASFAVPAMAAIDLDRAPQGVGVRNADARCGSATTPSCAAGGDEFDLTFVDPTDPSRRGSTDSFSIDVDAQSGAMITAYDETGRLLGVADRSDAGDRAERLTLTGLGDIARIHVSGRSPIAVADLTFAEVKVASRLPEPATWAMLLSGFVVMAALIRRRIRLSEARFTERMRRIAAGDLG